MTVLENMQAVLPSLPKNERKAAEYLLNYPHDIQRRSAEIIAQDAGISRSAIVRLCQKLGYQGWSEFKYAYLHEPALAAYWSAKAINSSSVCTRCFCCRE